MKLIKLGACALNQTPLDFSGNYNNIIHAIDLAIKEKVQVLCLPELCVTGYGCEDAFHMSHVIDSAWCSFVRISEYVDAYNQSIIDEDNYNTDTETSLPTIVVTVGLPIKLGPALYNCTAIFDGEALKIIPKQNLCSDGVHYENRWFKAWSPGVIQHVSMKSFGSVEFGDCVYELEDINIGVEICEDAWSADRPGSSLASRGVDIILNPSASHFSFGKNKTRERFVAEGSRAFKCAYVYSNLLGNESGRIIVDGDTYIATGGNIVAKGNRFSFKKAVLTTAVIDIDKNRVAQMQNGSLHVALSPGLDIGSLSSYIGINSLKESIINKPIEKIKYGPIYNLDEKFDSFTRAVALGLWDYMFKSKSKGFVISLSGGADSAAVACLVRSMVICAYNELEQYEIIEKLSTIDINLSKTDDAESFIKNILNEILLCVYQGTENSSSQTELAASKLALEIGSKYDSIYVQNVVNEYVELVTQVLGRTPAWGQDDLAMQNIQARVRAPSVWMLANIRGSLLLSTSNRSEAAVGYATMDGDTCGGLCPIAGVSKQFLLEWLSDYSNTHRNSSQFFGLSNVLRLQPTAELRPKEQEQTDETDLMPYSVLNKVEEMVVKYKMSPKEIHQSLVNDGVSRALDHVIKFFNLFTKNQWKRERYAPSFHLDDESLDPKTFYRFPILSSGFKDELNELMLKSMEEALE